MAQSGCGLSDMPAIILVRPQLGENIGTAARAMLNCGLTELRLVAPRDGWPSEKAMSASSGAVDVINNAKVFDCVADAVADLDYVCATTGRQFNMNKPIDNLEAGVERLSKYSRTGVLFGPERTGLELEDIIHANSLITIPLNPNFSSLNLAQAVLLLSYTCYRAAGLPEIDDSHRHDKTRPATQGELDGLVQHLVTELDNCEFFTSPQKRPSMIRNLYAAFGRMEPTEQDVMTFRGVIKALVAGRRNPPRSL